MLSLLKNQNRPESVVYLIGVPVPDASFVRQVIFVAKRLLLRQMVFAAAHGLFALTVSVTLRVTCVEPLLAVIVYVVLAAGETTVELFVPTLPTPRSIDA